MPDTPPVNPTPVVNPLLTAFFATPQGRLKRAIGMLGRGKHVGVIASTDSSGGLFLRIKDWLVPVEVIEAGFAANNGNPWVAVRAFQNANAKAPPPPAPPPRVRPSPPNSRMSRGQKS